MKIEETLDDNEIAGMVLDGRRDLFRLLIERYEKKLFSLGFSFFHNREEALDFCQDVFLKVYHALSSFEGRSAFSTWLYRIAYNHAVNQLRGAREYLSLAENKADALVSENETPEKLAIMRCVREAVREAVDGLSEKYRICIDLSFFYDLAYDEIARITGFPVGTVKSHILRAKKILRKKLSPTIG